MELAEDEPEVRAALESLRAARSKIPEASLDRGRLAAFVQRVLDHAAVALRRRAGVEVHRRDPVNEIAAQVGSGRRRRNRC